MEALGTGSITSKLSAIIVGRFRVLREDRTALTPDKCSGRGIHSSLEQLTSGAEHIPGLELVAFIGVDQDVTVHLFHLLYSVLVDLYSTSRRIFFCKGELPVKGLPPVIEIPHESSAVRRFIRAVPQVDHVTHLGLISPPD